MYRNIIQTRPYKAKSLIEIFFKAFHGDKGSIHQKESTIINFHALNNITSKFIRIKMREGEGEIDKPSIISGGFIKKFTPHVQNLAQLRNSHQC